MEVDIGANNAYNTQEALADSALDALHEAIRSARVLLGCEDLVTQSSISEALCEPHKRINSVEASDAQQLYLAQSTALRQRITSLYQLASAPLSVDARSMMSNSEFLLFNFHDPCACLA